MVNSASFPRFVKVVVGAGKSKVGNLREQHPMLLHFIYLPGDFFNTENGSVDETCKKKRMCIVLDWIAH